MSYPVYDIPVTTEMAAYDALTHVACHDGFDEAKRQILWFLRESTLDAAQELARELTSENAEREALER